MNINELSEKNLHEVVNFYKNATKDYFHLLPVKDCTNEELENMFLDGESEGDFTYLFTDKGSTLALVTCSKPKAEIVNMCVNFDLVDEGFTQKFLEFVIKQFSAITRVFIWVCSLDGKISEMLENYGFEYTGEQKYISKEHNLLQFRYVYKRKK